MTNVCIIGAGISGLSCIKQFKEENIPFVCYEKRNSLGGLWNYSDTERSVYYSCIQNHTRDGMAINDTQPSSHYNEYMTHQEYLNYLKQFDDESIKYNADVSEIQFLDEDEIWQVKVNNDVFFYTHVIVCSGHYSQPIIPDFVKNASLNIIHSCDYKKAEHFTNKNVLVVGCGNSALQIAEDLVGKANQISVSYRNMPIVIPRYIYGKPILQFFNENKDKGEVFFIKNLKKNRNQEDYGIPAPVQNLYDSTTIPTCSKLFEYSKQGLINFVPEINSIDKKLVSFSNGEISSVYDEVILGTGYKVSFPFLPSNINNKRNIDSFISKDKPNLFFIGMFQPIGPLPPAVSLQVKIVSKIIKKDIVIDINNTRDEIDSRRIWLKDYLEKLSKKYGI